MRLDEAGAGRGGRWRARAGAAVILAIAAATAACIALVSRAPLEPLRAAARLSLEWRGARFMRHARARLQSSLYDCGPTALADFLDLAGLPVPSDDSLRRLTATDASGTTLKNLEAASVASGLRVIAVQWDPAELWMLPVPSLVWVDRRHFVVVARRVGVDSVEIHDPAAGDYLMKGTAFARSWSGDALIRLDSISQPRGGSEVRLAAPSPAGHAGTPLQNAGGLK